MNELLVEPEPMSKKKLNEDLGKLLWGKNGGKFSMRRFFFALIKKKLKKS